ncbi:MAG: hypothetical protein SPC28_07400 [Alloprevotella sp.]|nr:hypothetical protein [Alloprevotella sp.]
MRNRFTLFLMLMFLMGTGMNAQTVVARMQDLANAATNSKETKATPSTAWTTSVKGGAIYDFADGKYLGGIVNKAVVEALEGDQYVTIAMWVYGRTSSLQSVFGYGDSDNGLAFELNNLKLKITAKGSSGFSESGNVSDTNMPKNRWNLVAYSLRGRSSTATTGTYRYLYSTTNDQYFTKNDYSFHNNAAVGEESQKFAIGSSCQGAATETFTGKIANLTVIRSGELLNNQSVLACLGDAPTKVEDENYKALYELYQTYLPYKNLFVEEKAGLPGYPTSYASLTPANNMDNYLQSAENYLNDPTNLTAYEIGMFSYIFFPSALDSLLADLVNYPEDRYFSIKNAGADNLGYLTYEPDATKENDGTEYIWTTAKASATAFNSGNTNHLWCFLNHTKVDGTTEHYLYNVGFKKYARPTKVVGTYGGYTWVLTDEPAPITLKVYDAPNHKMAITAKSAEVASDTVVYASVNTDYTGPVISYYAQGDGGVPFTFDWGTKDFVASDTTAVAALVRTPITLRSVVKDDNPLITGLDDNQTICTYSSTKAFRVPAGVTAYYAKEKDASNIVRLKAVPDGIVPANQGVLLVGAVNKTQAMLDVDYRTEATADVNIFSNTASGPTPMGANCYVLARTDAEGIGFYHATAGSTLSQGKAYLDFSGSSVRAFTLSFGDDDVTTGISNIEADGNAENAPVYDLSGRRIAEPLGRGIYIKNGKKYFVK